jgi:hypothetical protein
MGSPQEKNLAMIDYRVKQVIREFGRQIKRQSWLQFEFTYQRDTALLAKLNESRPAAVCVPPGQAGASKPLYFHLQIRVQPNGLQLGCTITTRVRLADRGLRIYEN